MDGNLLALTLARPSFGEALGDKAFVRAMLAFESALAQSQAATGVIPVAAGAAIERACAGANLSARQLAAEGKLAGSLAIPFVKALTAEVRAIDPAAASFVHYGSTSQDVLDTALVLCMRPCLAEADRVLGASVVALAAHARAHASTVILGRTMLQPAIPITAGLKIARWATALARCRARLAQTASTALCVQLGGPVGALDALGPRRAEVRRRVAGHLGLADARAWHSHRDDFLALAAGIAIAVGAIGKIARDIALLSQAEVGEMLESAPRKDVGGSSAMPHKRNPVACLQAIAAATRAPGLMATLLHAAGQEHERSIGAWQGELASWPELVGVLGSALDALERFAQGLVVIPARMQANLEALQGLVFSERLSRQLMHTMDRASAQSLVDDWCTEAVAGGLHLRQVAAAASPGVDLDAVFSIEAVVTDLAPALEEELGAL
ncbi:MAG: lyase family protein [Betaproteobacteria bacterium]